LLAVLLALPDRMRNRVYVSVWRFSVCPIHCCGFAAVSPAGERYRLIHSIAVLPVLRSNCMSSVWWPNAGSATLSADVGSCTQTILLNVQSNLPKWIPLKWITPTHTHTPVSRFFSGTAQVSRYRKGKTNLDFTEARDSEWQWHQLAICKSAPSSRQITTPAPHDCVFYRLDALPATQPTASKHCRVNTHLNAYHSSGPI